MITRNKIQDVFCGYVQKIQELKLHVHLYDTVKKKKEKIIFLNYV